MEHFTGLMSAVFTPFDHEGKLNLSLVPAYVECLLANGLKGLFVCGSNGEGPNMTLAERMEVAEAFVRAADKRIAVFVHVGHSAIADARRLAEHAQSIGADAVSAVACFYFKPSSIHYLVESMAAIAEAVPRLPFYYYHIPRLTGVDMDVMEFLRAAGKAIPNFAGIKYTDSRLEEYQSCLTYEQGKYDILYGMDEMLLPALAVGARGAIGSTYTFAAPLYYEVIEAFRKGDASQALRLHQRLVDMIDIILRYPMISGQKAIMKMRGLDLGGCRLPLQNLSTPEFDLLKSALSGSGIFDHLIQYDPHE